MLSPKSIISYYKLILLINLLINPVFILSSRLWADESYLLPVKAEPKQILLLKMSSWRNRDYEFFSWQELDGILIFDTADYLTQADFFKKLAFFTEKLGYTDIIHTDESLVDKHGYRAHNYAAADLARFFNLVRERKEILNNREQQLLKILLTNNILVQLGDILQPVRGGIISICRQSETRLRRHLFVHELLHAIYYVLPAYQEGVYAIWKTLSNREKEFWILFLWSNGYITHNPEIVINEFHAYLLQQLAKNIGWLLYERGIRDIIEAFPARQSFIEKFSRECKTCLTLCAAMIAAELTEAGREVGFDYLKYLDTMKPY